MNSRKACDLPRHDEGFTLVELLVVLVVLPIVVGAISLGLLSAFSLQHSVSGRLTDSGNAQVVSSVFERDVQSAGILTTNASPSPQCGSAGQYQLLAIAWNSSNPISTDPMNYTTWVSYVTQANAGSTSYSLLREYCTNQSPTPATSMVITNDLNPTMATIPPTISCVQGAPNCNANTGWLLTAYVTLVKFPVIETLSSVPGSTSPFQFILSATPRMMGNTPDIYATASRGFSPLTLLGGSSCTAQPTLSIGGSNSGNGGGEGVSINVGSSVSGQGGGSVTIGISCLNSVFLHNGSVFNTTAVYTPDPTTNIYSTSQGNSGTLPPVLSNPPVRDPFLTGGTFAVSPPLSPKTPGKCQPKSNGSIITCTAGFYTSDPAANLKNGGTITFEATSSSDTFDFQDGLSLPSNATANFQSAVYIFDPPTGGGSANDQSGRHYLSESVWGAVLCGGR